MSQLKSGEANFTAQRKKRRSGRPLVMIGVGGLLLILTAAFLIVSSLASSKTAIQTKGAPSVKVNQENVNLGDIKLGKTVNVALTLTNTGDQPLKVAEQPYIEVIQGC